VTLFCGIGLSVSKQGDGAGTVTGTSGLSCGDVCARAYARGTQVTLTATPDATSAFDGWGGACAGTGASCTLAMNSTLSVTASFHALSSVTLTLTKSGSGTGTVTARADLVCGSDCIGRYVPGAVVTVTAAPTPDNIFAGWSGACIGTMPSCSFTISSDSTVDAAFMKANLAVDVYTGAYQFCFDQATGDYTCSWYSGGRVTVQASTIEKMSCVSSQHKVYNDPNLTGILQVRCLFVVPLSEGRAVPVTVAATPDANPGPDLGYQSYFHGWNADNYNPDASNLSACANEPSPSCTINLQRDALTTVEAVFN
jgi:hypothetical protein